MVKKKSLMKEGRKTYAHKFQKDESDKSAGALLQKIPWSSLVVLIRVLWWLLSWIHHHWL